MYLRHRLVSILVLNQFYVQMQLEPAVEDLSMGNHCHISFLPHFHIILFQSCFYHRFCIFFNKIGDNFALDGVQNRHNEPKAHIGISER